MTFNPTAQQEAILAAFKTEKDLVVKAGAGTGKSRTLKLLAESEPATRFTYIAFNKAVVTDAQESMPFNVTARTAHSVAFRAVGFNYKNRLNGNRVPAWKLVKFLGLSGTLALPAVGGKTVLVDAEKQAALAMETVTRFCHSDRFEFDLWHVPLPDGIEKAGRNILAESLLPAAEKAWADIIDKKQSNVRFEHDHYLKMFQLDDPKLFGDVLLVDEAQDLSPVLKYIVDQQTQMKRVIVGDENQSIYGFTGAINAMQDFEDEGAQVLPLSQSFRFGQAVADAANTILSTLPTDLRLSGSEALESRLSGLDIEDGPAAGCVLTRTNAGAVTEVLKVLSKSQAPAVVGGTRQIVSLVEAAGQIKEKGKTNHPELWAFTSWEQIQKYVKDDPAGKDLAVLVAVVDKFGAPALVQALGRCVEEKDAEVIVSTAHKSKGREWANVRIAEDFQMKAEDGDLPPQQERQLAYVACTRAKEILDPGAIGQYFSMV